MAFLKLLISCAAIFTLVSAQSNNTVLQIEGIIANFQNAELVPVPIPVFNPSAILTASFTGVGNISPGQLVPKDQVQSAPNLTLTPANSSVTFSGKYVVAMIDPQAVGTDESGGQVRHWLVYGVDILSDGTVSTDNATQITTYNGPAPPPGSGAHRYTIVVYSQPSSFTPPANLSTPGVPLSINFDFPGFVQSTGLGPLVAGNYFTVENGTATTSIPATSSVITSTLPAAKSTGSVSGSSAKPSASGSSGSKSGAISNSVAMGSLVGAFAFMTFIML